MRAVVFRLAAASVVGEAVGIPATAVAIGEVAIVVAKVAVVVAAAGAVAPAAVTAVAVVDIILLSAADSDVVANESRKII